MNSISLRAMRGLLLREVITLLLFSSLMLQNATAVAPDWWSRQAVLTSGAVADDYTVVNVGQLKNLASKTAQELEGTLAGGAGTVVNGMISAWAAAPAEGVARDDYAALTLGQLKTVARPFYDRLIAAGVLDAGSYPWSGDAANDYTLANLGQLKRVFAFALPAPDPNDTNHNGIPDAWEMQMFGSLSHTNGAEDTDGDGMSNFDEWQQGSNPNQKDSKALHLEVHVLMSL